MVTELELLQNISEKLNQLVILTRMANSKVIDEFKSEIAKDQTLQTILDLADGQLSSSELKQKTIELSKESKSTIERRITVLMEKGALTATKNGKEVYYSDSGLYR